MARTTASRKYLLTINNPQEHGFDHDTIKGIISRLSGCLYWCLCDEVGRDTGTYHTHVYMVFQNAKEFSSIQQRFYGAHIDIARGTHQENRDYLRKEGKWLNDSKHETSVPGTFEESGELPEEPDKRVKQSEAILALVETGATDAEILREHPSAMNHLPRIQQTRQALLEEKYRKTFRELHVTYIYGQAGVGKTRSIMDKHGYENVYRVTDYEHPFDGYAGEDVLLLDEFRSGIQFSTMLNVIDGYPFRLPCRYVNRVACYTKVYIASNIPLEKQYPNIQADEPASYQAFLRRIHETVFMPGDDDPDFPF